MKVIIGDRIKYAVAEMCVAAIKHRRFEQHEFLMGRCELVGQNTFTDFGWSEMRNFIRSIDDKWERQSFIMLVGFLFKKDREENRFPIRGRDYIREVIAAGNGYLIQPDSRFYAESQAFKKAA